MKVVPTRRTDYAIRALIHLANAEASPVPASAIGEAMEIPTGFLQQVLRELQQAGLVTSRPGPAGGYALSRPAAEITVLQIVEALEGPLRNAECALRGARATGRRVRTPLVWSSARDALCDELAGASLERVAADDRALGRGRPRRAGGLAPRPPGALRSLRLRRARACRRPAARRGRAPGRARHRPARTPAPRACPESVARAPRTAPGSPGGPD